MRKPLIAIVGRPNVGKSTLFNRLVGRRQAITHDAPGVTRDRHYAATELCNRDVVLVDTGGFVPGEDDEILAAIRSSASVAINEADVIVWLTSVRDDVTTADEEVGALLRRTDKPVIVAVNKCDSDRLDVESNNFWSLGVHVIVAVSAEHGRGIGDLEDAIGEALDGLGPLHGDSVQTDAEAEDDDIVEDGADEDGGDGEAEDDDGDAPERPAKAPRGGRVRGVRLAIVGRPNVGKSTLINALIGKQRMLATAVAGTTRDAIDVELEWRGQRYTLVDTAGLRRKSRIINAVEGYSVSRSVHAIERCHVAVLVLDASQSLADQDARIASLVERRNRACCLVVNKWDAVDKDHRTMKAYEVDLQEQLPALAFAPRVFISALTGQRVDKVMEAALRAYESFNRILPTSAINRWIAEAQKIRQPPVYQNKRLKLYFGAQTATRPPRLQIQVNNPDAMSPSYERFLINSLRERFDLGGTPLRLQFVGRSQRRADRTTDSEFVPATVAMVDLNENPWDDEAEAAYMRGGDDDDDAFDVLDEEDDLGDLGDFDDDDDGDDEPIEDEDDEEDADGEDDAVEIEVQVAAPKPAPATRKAPPKGAPQKRKR